ncbi:MAG: SDR family NAD(P)-dependent oxidoreductase [Bacteroidota bacterium]
MTQKTILITGSTDGIGKLAAAKLAGVGHQLILHGRNPDKLESTIQEIRSSSGNNAISGLTTDFSDLKAVREMVKKLSENATTIDVLINNAGVYKSRESVTEESLEMRFVVNYLAPYLLTKGLLPLLKKAKSPRVINLSSAAQAPVSLAALEGEKQLSHQAAYAQSKLAITMWSTYLARSEPSLNVVAVNPGSLLNTNMVREGFGFHQAPADKGASILFDLATSPKYENASGKYFDNDLGGFRQMHPSGLKWANIEELIRKTEELIFR